MNNSIMCYRVSEPRMAVLREACEDLGLGILETDLATDVIAIGSLMVVVDPEAIGPRDLPFGLLDILNRALIRHDLAHGQEVQRFGAAFVDLVLRVDHVPDDAVTVIIPIDVAR